MMVLSVQNIIPCFVIERLNRFVVQVEVDGRRVLAHINNTGRLAGFLEAGRVGYCIPRDSAGRTAYRLIAVRDGRLAALIDTALQMEAFEEAVGRRMVPWLDGAVLVRRNVRLGDSLIDYLIGRGAGDVYLEVKSAVLRDGGLAMYPDCPTVRGRRHVKELARLVRNGGRGTILFVAALPGVNAFCPNMTADPGLYRELLLAVEAGVELRAIRMALDAAANGVIIDEFDLPVVVPPEGA